MASWLVEEVGDVETELASTARGRGGDGGRGVTVARLRLRSASERERKQRRDTRERERARGPGGRGGAEEMTRGVAVARRCRRAGWWRGELGRARRVPPLPTGARRKATGKGGGGGLGQREELASWASYR